MIILFYWAIPGIFLCIFGFFNQTLQILQQINVKKCPASIQCWGFEPTVFRA